MHGFHIPESVNNTHSCVSAGASFNPYQMDHGGPGDAVRHPDDLSNIEAGSARVTKSDIADKLISLPGARSITGRILEVYADPDDLSKGIHELAK